MIAKAENIVKGKIAARKDVSAWREMRILLFKADLSFVDACRMAGISDVQKCYLASWRGSLRGSGSKLRDNLITFLNKKIVADHSVAAAGCAKPGDES